MALFTSPDTLFQVLSSGHLLGSASVSLSVLQPGNPSFQQMDEISSEDSWEVEVGVWDELHGTGYEARETVRGLTARLVSSLDLI